MMRRIVCWLVLLASLEGAASAREAKLVRYPDYHNGKIVFSVPRGYLDR